MKRILTAAFALSLMAGASAFAQDQSAAPAAPAASMPSTDQAAPPAPADAAPPAPAGDMAAPPASGGDMAAPAAPMAPAASADTPAGAPPAAYPVCKHKGEDRCMQKGGVREESDMKTAHMHKHMKHSSKKMHHMSAKMKKTDAAPAAAATPPAQ